MSRKIQKSRLLAFKRQNGRCYYCDFPMWLRNLDDFTSKYGISVSQAKRLMCTAEHLIARQDGGSDASKNIVAACWFCNSARHKRTSALSSEAFKKLVFQRIKQLKWHQQQFHHMLEII